MQPTNNCQLNPLLEIRLAETAEEREQVFRLRYKVYIEEMGKTSHYADDKHKTIIEPLDSSAKIFAAFSNGQVVGTARTNLSRTSNLDFYTQPYKMDEIVGDAHPEYTSVGGKLIVQKEFRGQQIAIKLIKSLYQYLLQEGIKFDFSECDAELVSYYNKLGYQSVGTLYHPEYGEGSVIMLDVFNWEYLERVNSPLKDIGKTLISGQI
jgi:predicted GNAT family N-acyltransferase